MDKLEEKLKTFSSHFTWSFEDKAQRDIEDLKKRLQDSLRDNPDKQVVPTKTLIGYLLVSTMNRSGKRQYNKSLEWFDDALKDNTKEMEEDDAAIGDKIIVLTCKAWVYLKLGKTRETKALVSEIEKLVKNESSPKVQAYMSAHKAFAGWWFGPYYYDMAAKLYEDALSAYPEHSPDKEPWLFELVLIVGRLERRAATSVSPKSGSRETTSREEELLQKVIQWNPKRSLARVFLGCKLVKHGRQTEADAQFKEALHTDPHNVTVLQRIGEVYRKQGSLKARQFFEDALILAPDSSFILYQISLLYKQDKDTESIKKALHYCEKAIEKSGEVNFPAKCDRAFYHSLLGNTTKARDYYCELIENPDRINRAFAHFYFGKFLEMMQEEENAIAQYKKCIDTKKADSYPGTLAVEILKKKMALQLSKEENNTNALETLGWVHEKIGDHQKAVNHYEQAFKVNQSKETATNLASLLLTLKKTQRAYKYIDAIKDDVDFESDYREMKGTYHLQKGQNFEVASKTMQARKEFALAVDCENIEGLQCLCNILSKCRDSEKCSEEWFSDCAKVSVCVDTMISHCDEQMKSSFNEMKDKLRNFLAPDINCLKDLYLKHLQFSSKQLLQCPEDDLISCCVDTLLEARGLLDRIMSEFQSHCYQLDSFSNRCSYFYITGRNVDVRQRLKTKLEDEYRWTSFVSRFSTLFNFLVGMQPSSNYKQNKWIIHLFSIVNKQKHDTAIVRMETVHSEKLPVDIFRLAKSSVLKVSKIVSEFHKEMK
ncbi:antiviral innate immune response effector IFIT1-like [Glandiceps talaboti]